MTAVWFWLRTEARSTVRAFFTLALLIGLSGGVVIAAFAGAHRTDAAYPAFLRAAHASDVEVGVERLNGEEVPFLDQVEALPQVVAHARRAYVFLVSLKPNGEPDYTSAVLGQTLVAVDRDMFRSLDAEKVLAGRHADPDRADEITVGRELVRQFHVRVGQTLDVASFSPAASERVLGGGGGVAPDGPRVRLHVVGEVIGPGELAAASFDNTPIHMTPAFFHVYGHAIGSSQATRLRLRRGAADLPEFRRALERLSADRGRLAVVDQPGLTAKVQRSIHLQAVALRLFGVLIGAAGVLIVGQALVRQLVIASEDYAIGRGVGMTRSQLAALSLARAAIVGVFGAALAVVVAIAASPFALIGVARIVSPAAGVVVDGALVVAGALAIVVLVLGVAAWPAWWTARSHQTEQARGDVGRSRIAAALAMSGLSPAAVAGSKMAFEQGAGRASVPVRSTIVGAVLAVAALATSVCFGASLDHLFTTPRLYGWGWDLAVGNPYAYDIRDEIVPGLMKDRDVAAVASISTASVTINGRSLTAIGVGPLRGTVVPPLVSGRQPTAPDEITIGPKTLRALHRHIGDRVRVAGGGNARSMTVVGRGIYASVGIADPGGVGEGAGLTLDGLRSVVPDTPENIFPIVLRPGRDLDKTAARLQKEYAVGQVNAIKPTRPTDIENYRPVRWVPILLAGVLACIALGTLVHTLVSSVRRRRRDLALLKTLGFVRRQVRATIAWQATALTTIALAVGVPVGVAVGTWVWRVYALQQGVVPEPAVPLLPLALLVPLMLIIANAIAAVPSASAARTRAAVVLSTE